MKNLLWLLLAFSTCAWAQLGPFPQYIDHHKFVQLSPEQQKKFLLSVMETISEMEQAAYEQGLLQPGLEINEKRRSEIQKLKKVLQQFTESLIVDTAYADDDVDIRWCSQASYRTLKSTAAAEPKTCMYGSYMSTMTLLNGKPICVRPACSPVKAYRDAHNVHAATSGCGYGQMACNPSLYGVSSSNSKPSCVKLDLDTTPNEPDPQRKIWKELGHNAALSCMMEVISDPNKDSRLQAIADNIVNCDSGAAAAFNQLLQTITNMCICGTSAFGENAPAHLRNFSPVYVNYMKHHRSCYSLLSQTALITEKMGDLTCHQNIFPVNFDVFKNDISRFKNYHERVDALIRRDQNTSSVNANKRRKAMSDWSQGSIIYGQSNSSTQNRRTVNDPSLNVDQVAGYILSIDGNTANRSDTLASRHCPLEFSNTIQYECQVTGSALKGADKNITVAAEVKFRVAGRGEYAALPSGKSATVNWNVASAAVADQNGISLSKVLPEAAGAAAIPVSVSAVISGQTSPITCNQSLTATVAQPLTNCAVQGEAVATISEDNKLTIQSPTVLPVPENAIAGEVTFIFGNDANGTPVAAMENIPLSADDSIPNQVVEYNFQAVMTSEGQTVKCPGKAKFTPVAPVTPAQTCTGLTATISAITGKTDKMKFDASVTVGQPLKEGEVVKWEVPGATLPAPSQALTLAIAEIPKPTAAFEVKAKIMKGETQVADCGSKKVEPPTVVTPPAVAGDCKINGTAANPTPDGKVIITANAVLTAEGKSGEKFDWSAPEEKKDKGASESFQITAPKEDTKIKITAKAKYKVSGEDKTTNCSGEVPVKKAAAPAAPAGGGGPMMPQQQQQPMPMQMPDIFIQGIR